MPTFAFINGMALGGGLELTLHCHYRTVSAAAAGIALPECFLGMFPGWGGAYLVPNLIGAERAVTLIIENPLNQNRMLDGKARTTLGLADALFDGADFLERSLDWAGAVVAGTIDRRPRPRSTAARPGTRRWPRPGRSSTRKVGGASPGPYRALELMAAAKTADRTSAYAAEDEALADLIMGDELRASLYAFELVRKRARKPAGAPDPGLARPVTKVGVVGAGLMASQLATLFLRQLQGAGGDHRPGPGAGGPGPGDHSRRDRHAAGARSGSPRTAPTGCAALITGTTDLADFADCDFVIEAVFEETVDQAAGLRRSGEARLRRAACWPPTPPRSRCRRWRSTWRIPERVVGFHFFNPVAVLPLLEVVRARTTDDATLATALAVAKDLRKNAVLVEDATGFVVNRVLLRMMGEVFAAVDEGTPVKVADAALAPLGLPMPPFVLLQLVGPPIVLHVLESLHASFGDRFPVSDNLRALVATQADRDLRLDRRTGETYVPDEVAGAAAGRRPAEHRRAGPRAGPGGAWPRRSG